MKRVTRISLAMAVLIGILLATAIAIQPRNMTFAKRQAAMLRATMPAAVSPDPRQRASGWDRLQEISQDLSDEDLLWLEENAVLKSIKHDDPGIILDAALHFADLGIQPVQHAPIFATALAEDAHDPRQSLDWFIKLKTGPLEPWSSAIRGLLSSDSPDIRQRTIAAILSSTDGRTRNELNPFMSALPEDDRRNRAVLALALGLSGSPDPRSNDPVISATTALRTLLADQASGNPSSPDVLTGTPASLLHLAGADTGLRVLQERADEGEPAALRALKVSDRDQVEQNARAVIDRKRSDIEIRRLAAWQLPALDDGTTTGLLQAAPADGENTVHATALLAEKHLSPQALRALANDWFTDLDPDRRRTAAVITALSGKGLKQLQEAEAREQDPHARRTMRLAMLSFGSWPLDLDAAAYTARTRKLPNGRIDPDSTLLLLLGGDRSALADLSSQPELPSTNLNEEDRARWRRAIQWRDWLLARMVPEWQRTIGEPIGGDEEGLRLRLDLLEAMRVTSESELSWDPDTRAFRSVANNALGEDDGAP